MNLTDLLLALAAMTFCLAVPAAVGALTALWWAT